MRRAIREFALPSGLESTPHTIRLVGNVSIRRGQGLCPRRAFWWAAAPFDRRGTPEFSCVPSRRRKRLGMANGRYVRRRFFVLVAAHGR